ncbi:M20 family metallopeptidase [Paenisporosarcina cavernae]|uniref:M20 family peptidase n=1 Tax=Paenisporosarcina cavernae TaxID=2320858 RepID=A0A385YUV9_9BACL|nr:M20/M25/M40 family metallo-hydrolase [Paenisporosarcina cavernae]AYC30261.1 M20 family peptidase [Paenisporosarcina cavernae]
MIELLKDLISIKSDTLAGANEALQYCSEWLTKHSITHEVLENKGKLMLEARIGSGDSTIIWNGHVDVVPGNEEQFIPRLEGDKLYGRGAADMKAGVAAMMEAFRRISEDPTSLSHCILLHIVTDEETGGMDTSGYLVEQGRTGDFVICGEPTHLELSIQSKGMVDLDINFHGKAAHGSRPWQGVNAIEMAYDFHEKMQQLPFTKANNEFYESPSINLAKISAGNRYNVVPDCCEVSYDIRFVPGQDPEEIVKELTELATSLHSKNELEIYGISPAVTTERSSEYVQTLAKITADVRETEPTIFGQHGAADTRYYAETGAGAIEFGPSGEDWHGPEEFVYVSSALQFVEILVRQATT